MQDLPHLYSASASVKGDEDIALKSAGLPVLTTAAPAEFGGPGDRWSPETLLVGAVADCFVLTFKAVARAAKFPWVALSCHVEGTLDRIDRATQFTSFTVQARLHAPHGADKQAAERLLEKAERACLITNSLKAPCQLHVEVVFADASEPAATAS